MSGERYDLFRLYFANMEQHMVMKRAYNLALLLFGVIAVVYTAVLSKNYSSLWLIFSILLFLYLIVGNFIVGIMVFRPPNRIIKWVANQKLKEPESTNAGELAATAAKLLRNGSVTKAKELLDQVFKLKNVGNSRLIFANTVLADLFRTQGELEKSQKILKSNVLGKKRDAGSYSFLVLGRTLLQLGEYERAIEALANARSLLKEGELGVPDLYKQGSKNRALEHLYYETLQVFVPFYLGKAYFWAKGEHEQEAAEHLNSAVILCMNRNMRPLLKEDFKEKE